MGRLLSLAILLMALPVAAQVLNSHQVNPDGSITFRYQNSGAHRVVVNTDAAPHALAMHRDEEGLWSVTTAPLSPEYYSYSFVVDGVQQFDPLNRGVVPNIVARTNFVLVPGRSPQPWELTAIPHGDVTRHVYTTHIARNLPDDQEAYLVYTPPGYDAHRTEGYPILYLLHGWTDMETGWTAVGRANLIFDSLIAAGKIVPMIVVMPLGYGNYDFVTTAHDTAWKDPDRVDENTRLFGQMLLSEIAPAVEHEYHVAPGAQNHAIAGLSMGGLESLSVGLNHPGQFGWTGAFSSAIEHEQFDTHFGSDTPEIAQQQKELHLLWVACGTGDTPHIQPSRDFAVWARAKGLPVTAIETPGKHTWLVWRDNLLHFAPLLFRK